MIFNDIVMLEYDLYEIEKHTHLWRQQRRTKKGKN